MKILRCTGTAQAGQRECDLRVNAVRQQRDARTAELAIDVNCDSGGSLPRIGCCDREVVAVLLDDQIDGTIYGDRQTIGNLQTAGGVKRNLCLLQAEVLNGLYG